MALAIFKFLTVFFLKKRLTLHFFMLKYRYDKVILIDKNLINKGFIRYDKV